MGYREPNRLEYLRQPHVLAIVVILAIIFVTAITTGVRRMQQIQRAATADTYHACKEFVSDDLLCRFAANNQARGSANSIVTTTTTSGPSTEVEILEIESSDRMKSTTLKNDQPIEAYIVIDAVTYMKDYDEDVWLMYTDVLFEPSSDQITYNFSSANSQDVVEFRDYYTYQGVEACEDYRCHVYEITYPDEPGISSRVWFDTEQFLLRKHRSSNDNLIVHTRFSYQNVSVAAPSPVKEITEDELDAYL